MYLDRITGVVAIIAILTSLVLVCISSVREAWTVDQVHVEHPKHGHGRHIHGH